MQFYAFNEKKLPIHAKDAQKNFNYTCIECQTRVRVRGGCHRQLHFYHLVAERSCHLHKKGMIHLHLQEYLACLLPKNDCRLEYRFAEINRIADVAWLSKKIIFEIQCSPISNQEIYQRNQDYQSLGWQVVWILHDQRYNQKILHPAEYALSHHPHYFSNMNTLGEGIIYDQFESIEKGRRLFKAGKFPVNVLKIMPFTPSFSKKANLKQCQKRLKSWPLRCEGDLFDHIETTYYQQAVDFEKAYLFSKYKNSLRSLAHNLVNSCILHPYQVLFRYILEKACR